MALRTGSTQKKTVFRRRKLFFWLENWWSKSLTRTAFPRPYGTTKVLGNFFCKQGGDVWGTTFLWSGEFFYSWRPPPVCTGDAELKPSLVFWGTSGLDV